MADASMEAAQAARGQRFGFLPRIGSAENSGEVALRRNVHQQCFRCRGARQQVCCQFGHKAGCFDHCVLLRVEGAGEDTKVTVNFPSYGLKKLIAKFAGIKIE